MIYPSFPKKGDTVGICAPSAGIAEEDFPEFDLSLSHLRSRGYKITETASVRSGLDESAPSTMRAAEFNSLIGDPEVKAVLCAAGGDFLISMLPYVDYEAFAKNPKWVQGYSDPTSLLYSITTLLDVATIYGVNAGGFFSEKLHRSLEDGLSILSGNIPVQGNYDKYERDRSGRQNGYNLTEPVVWESTAGNVNFGGRLIGGCLDCLCDVIGTRFDGGKNFVKKYRGDSIVWYFDIFAMKAESVHNMLFRMKDMGYFDGTAGIVFGRVCFPGSFSGLSYREATEKILPDIPMIFEADVGHVPPKMTLINGALASVDCRDGKGTLTMDLT